MSFNSNTEIFSMGAFFSSIFKTNILNHPSYNVTWLHKLSTPITKQDFHKPPNKNISSFKTFGERYCKISGYPDFEASVIDRTYPIFNWKKKSYLFVITFSGLS